MSLFDELGGALAIRAALDAFYPKVLADPQLRPFFDGIDLERLKQTQAAFFAMVLGGPNEYMGRNLTDAHDLPRRRGMSRESFDRFVGVFREVLEELSVPDEQIGQLMDLCEGGRPAVLGLTETSAP